MAKFKSLPIILSLTILTIIFFHLDLTKFHTIFENLNFYWFGLGLFLFVPIYTLLACRLRYLTNRRLSLQSSLQIVLAGGALNTILPSKGGDLGKAFFIKNHLDWGLAESSALVVVERFMDLFALVILMIVGVLWMDSEYIHITIFALITGFVVLLTILMFFVVLRKNLIAPNAIRKVARLSVGITAFKNQVERYSDWNLVPVFAGFCLSSWAIQLLQFYTFFMAVGYSGPPQTIFALIPVAVMFGLLPITLAGIGTRDIVIITLFSPWAPVEQMAGLALLSHLRYVLPGIAGVPAVKNEIGRF